MPRPTTRIGRRTGRPRGRPVTVERSALGRLIASRGWSAARLAAVLLVDVSTVARWIRGQMVPDPSRIRRLAKAIDVDVAVLTALLADPHEASATTT